MMATRRQGSPTKPKYKIDSKPYSQLVKQTCTAAYGALSQYGEPTVSLADLRREVNQQMGTKSLSEWIVRERQVTL